MRPTIQNRTMRLPATAMSLLIAAAGLATAEEPTGDNDVIVTGYLFASALDGRSSTTPNLPVADVDLSFGDVLEDLDFGLMTAIELRRGPWSFIGDLMYSKVSPGGTLPRPVAVSAELEQKSLTLQGSVLYRVQDSARIDVDLGAGLRYWSVDSGGVIAPGAPFSIGFSHRESWLDPVVIARMKADLGGNWSVTLAGDVGGSGGSSDLTWQVLATVNYQMNDRFSLRTGYRVLSVDYEDEGYLYDMTMRGPVLGVSMRF
jgi:hypothetical protein